MNLKLLSQLFSLRDLRNAIFGSLVVFGGVGLALTTIWAQRTGNVNLAQFAAIASLVFVFLILVFIVPPLARSASTEASQMNLPFEFTVGGAMILGLIVIVGFSAWNTGNNLLFLVLSFLGASLIVGFFVGNFCLKKLDVKMRFPETIFAGEPTPIIVSLNNRKKIFPTFSVVTEVRGINRENSALLEDVKKILPEKWAIKFTKPPIIKHTLNYFLTVPRSNMAENKVEHIFEHRGRFIIKDFELSTKFPFSFFRHRRRLSAQETELVIFPKLAPVDGESFELPLESGKLTAQRKGIGQDLLSLRDYQPMDDLRHIDWKATARSNRLIIREFSAEDDKRVTIIFDSRFRSEAKPMKLREKFKAEQSGKNLNVDSEQFENGVSQTSSLLAYFTEEQAEIRLIIDNEVGEFNIGREHLYSCLRRLAVISPITEENARFSYQILDKIFTERENNYTFFITAEKEEELPDELIQRAKIVRF